MSVVNMSLAESWNPRRHLGAAIGWAVFVLVTLAALLAAELAATEAQRRSRADTVDLLTELATQSGQILASRLETRRQLVQATAAQIASSGDHSAEALRRHLEALQYQFPEFAWLGVADDQGRIVAGTLGQLQDDQEKHKMGGLPVQRRWQKECSHGEVATRGGNLNTGQWHAWQTACMHKVICF